MQTRLTKVGLAQRPSFSRRAQLPPFSFPTSPNAPFSGLYVLLSARGPPRQSSTPEMADTGPQLETTYPIQYPLTTIWVAPTDCPAIIRTDGPEKCRPPEYDLWYSGHGYYSPGVCPYGYSVGCSETTGYVNGNAIDESETAGFCVPRYVRTSINNPWNV